MATGKAGVKPLLVPTHQIKQKYTLLPQKMRATDIVTSMVVISEAVITEALVPATSSVETPHPPPNIQPIQSSIDEREISISPTKDTPFDQDTSLVSSILEKH